MSAVQPLPAVTEFLAQHGRLFIAGEWRDAAAGERIESFDPATGVAIGTFAAGAAADVDSAVIAARRAFRGPWRKLTPYERGRLLQKAASLIEQHSEELAQLITLENGKPLAEARREVATAVSWTDYYAGWSTKLLGDTIPVSLPGQFLNYTVFAGVTNEQRLAREEIFGPVLCALPFKDFPDAIQQGNDSPYGLAAGVWTRDLRKAHQAAAALEAGTVWVNCYNAFDNASPWGGFRQSGWGREKGPYGLDLFTQIKSVIINYT